MKQKLLDKIKNKELIAGTVGLGYVGLPLAVEKAKAGFKTIGFDVQPQKVDMVNKGINYIGDVVDSELKNLVKSNMLSATNDFSFIKDVNFIAICVPTPLDRYQQPDVSYIKSSASQIAKYLKKDTIVVLESTIYPGATEELVRPILESSGLICGKDFYLGFSPERVDPGNLIYKIKNTPKVVGGIGKDATEVIAAVYETILGGNVFKCKGPAVAEMEKLLENTYRNVNIALINEVATLCDKMNINVWEVIEAAKTKPYGFQPFYPGPGVGGHCIPLDPYYLSFKAKEYGFHTTMIETAAIINDKMPAYVVDRAARILNKKKKALNGSEILVLGAAYKQDIDDYRESPALAVIKLLKESGCHTDYYDPYIEEYKYKGDRGKRIPELTPWAIGKYDLIIIATAHTTIDYDMVVSTGKKILDLKNVIGKLYKDLDFVNVEAL